MDASPNGAFVMAVYLLDTNHLSQCLNKVSRLRERIHIAHRSGSRFGTIVPALCELEVFISGSTKVEASHRALKRLASYVRVWPIDPEITIGYARLFLDLRTRGRMLSQVDLMIAATAQLKQCVVLTSDRDFEALPDLVCESWMPS
jgi:predicted nucleic acid-binding protein